MTTAAAPSSVEGSVVFTDLVGFTEFNGVAGDAAAMRVLDAQAEMVHRLLAGCADARLVKEIGDGLMLWFGSAHDALTCASAMIAAVESGRDDETFPLAIRVGVHHGPALARGDDLVGQTVNIASRISDLAGPGELLLSENVLDACDAACRPAATAIGAAHVKGVEDPIWLYRLTSV